MAEIIFPPSLYFNNMYDNILVDGKNIVFRATMAARSSGFSVHPVTIMIRMMDKWRRNFSPSNWHIFWDVPKNDLWRKDLYPDYKGGRPSYDEEISGYIKNSQKIAALIFNNMGMTQYIKAKNEADDLIYAFVLAFKDDKNLIITSDKDATQIPYHLGVDVYSPGKNKHDIIPVPEYDPVIVKSLAGDKSDNIPNYQLVRDLTAHKIIDKGIDDFLELKGRDLFERNKKLVDFSLNPYLEENVDFIKNMRVNAKFSIKNIQKIIAKFGVSGLNSEIVTKIKPFKDS